MQLSRTFQSVCFVIIHAAMIWNDVSDPLMEKSKSARRHLSATTQPAVFSSNKSFGVQARLSWHLYNDS